MKLGRIVQGVAAAAVLAFVVVVLPSTMAPRNGAPRSPTLVIGDVHGCFAELQRLLRKAPVTAEVILLGDVIGKGPNQLRTLRFVRNRPRTRTVLGNHELALLGLLEQLKAMEPAFPKGNWSFETAHKRRCRRQASRGKPMCAEDRMALVAALDDADITWLRSLPPYLVAYDGADGKVLAVHGGFDPGGCMRGLEMHAFVT